MQGEYEMSRASISPMEIDIMLNEDSDYKAEYERLKPRYELIKKIVHGRNEQKYRIIKYGQTNNVEL